jgi:hypothetical protein
LRHPLHIIQGEVLPISLDKSIFIFQGTAKKGKHKAAGYNREGYKLDVRVQQEQSRKNHTENITIITLIQNKSIQIDW